jgi:hypothetical protein
MTAAEQGALFPVDTKLFTTIEHDFGPYAVVKQVEHFSRPFMKLRRRDLPADGQSVFQITIDEQVAVCVIDTANPFPVEVRRGVSALVDDDGVEISKRWLRPIAIVGRGVDWVVRRRGPFGWRLCRSTDDSLLAMLRYGSLSVRGDLEPREAALLVAVVETDIPSTISPLAWLRGL